MIKLAHDGCFGQKILLVFFTRTRLWKREQNSCWHGKEPNMFPNIKPIQFKYWPSKPWPLQLAFPSASEWILCRHLQTRLEFEGKLCVGVNTFQCASTFLVNYRLTNLYSNWRRLREIHSVLLFMNRCYKEINRARNLKLAHTNSISVRPEVHLKISTKHLKSSKTYRFLGSVWEILTYSNILTINCIHF